MPGSTASRSSSNHTNPKPGGLRATQASLIWPKSRKKSRRSRASASGGKLPTKTCAARGCPRSSARPRGAAQEKSAAFAALVRACTERSVARLAPRGLPYLGAFVRVTCTHTEPVSYPPRREGARRPGECFRPRHSPIGSARCAYAARSTVSSKRSRTDNPPVCWRGSFAAPCLQVFLQGLPSTTFKSVA